MSAREFWLAKPDLDFDLNWKKILAAEYPHKDTLVDCLHVIEKSAYDLLARKLEIACEALRCVNDEIGDSQRRDVPIIRKIIKEALAKAEEVGE